MRLLVLVALAGCAPVVDLPDPRTAYVAPAPSGPAPNPDGPCLQEIRRRRSRWLWKRGVEQRSISEATSDDGPAHAIALRADRLERAGLAFVAAGMPTMMAGYFTSLSTLASSSPVTLEVGLPVLASGLALLITGRVMESRAEPIRKAAIAEYNGRCR